MRATRFRCLPQKFYLHEELGAKIAEVAEPSERLYDSLLGELPELVGAPGLYLSADRALNFIPFQALKRNPAGPYPVEDHTMTYLTQGKWRVERGGLTTAFEVPFFWAGFHHLGPGVIVEWQDSDQRDSFVRGR